MAAHAGIVEGEFGPQAVRALSVALLGLLLIVSAWWDSAFDLRYWAPLTVLALAVLLAQLLAGTLTVPRRGPLAIATGAIWCFAAYVLLTAAWSQTAAGAWEEGARSIFYAALWTLAVINGGDGYWRQRLGSGLVIGISAVAAITLLGLLGSNRDLLLAGRLNSPVGYRNGTAALFAFAVWPLIGIAARRGVASGVRAASFSAAALCLSLAFLTQSRGVLIGLVLGGAVSLAIGPDRLRRAWLAIGAVLPVAIFSGALLTPYDAFLDNDGIVTSGDIHKAAVAALLLAVLSFFAGLLYFVFDNGLRSSELDRGVRVVAGGALAVLILGVGIGGLAKVGDPVHYANTKIDEFRETEPEATGGSTRLGSVGGQRSDLWRVALDQFAEHPLAGAGAGSYEFSYYRHRDTDRNLNDAHSLPLRLLADTGLIGAGLFLLWLLAAAVAVAKRAREAIGPERLWVAGLAAAGVTVLAQCLTDWLWLLPGLVGLAFIAVGLAAGGDPEGGEAAGRRWGPGRVAAAAMLAAATIGVTFLFLSDLYVRRARVEAFDSSQAKLSAARTAAWLNPVAVTPLYLQAGALEREGDRAAAKRALEDALELEPDNFVTLGLLGDFDERGGNSAAARGYYRQALALNPLDSGLRKLSEGNE